MSIIDFISDEDYSRYEELLAKATELKANAPKPVRASRGPMTLEQKKKLAEGRYLKAQENLNRLLEEQE